MTLNQLVTMYPDVRYEVSNGKKRLARVTVEYSVTGSPESIAKFLEDLDLEWPFSQQRCLRASNQSGLRVQVEYVVKADETEQFVEAVPYRGRKIVLIS